MGTSARLPGGARTRAQPGVQSAPAARAGDARRRVSARTLISRVAWRCALYQARIRTSHIHPKAPPSQPHPAPAPRAVHVDLPPLIRPLRGTSLPRSGRGIRAESPALPPSRPVLGSCSLSACMCRPWGNRHSARGGDENKSANTPVVVCNHHLCRLQVHSRRRRGLQPHRPPVGAPTPPPYTQPCGRASLGPPVSRSRQAKPLLPRRRGSVPQVGPPRLPWRPPCRGST